MCDPVRWVLDKLIGWYWDWLCSRKEDAPR
jgi:hypothetical protein